MSYIKRYACTQNRSVLLNIFQGLSGSTRPPQFRSVFEPHRKPGLVCRNLPGLIAVQDFSAGTFRDSSQSGTFLPQRQSFAVHIILDLIPDIVGLQAQSPDRHSGKPVFFHNIQLGFHRLFVLTPDLVEF